MRKAVVTFLLCLTAACAGAQTDWQLKKDEDGLKVYTAESPTSNFKSVKVECVVNVSASQLVAFLLDMTVQPDWVYNSKSAKLIKKVKDNEFIFYSEVNVPWPCANRDYVAHITIAQPSPQLVTIDSHAEPDMVPVNKDLVRVQHSIAHWDVISLSKQSVKIVYTLNFDPGGSVPAWLTNMFLTKGPFQTFQKLKTGVNKPVYQNAHFDFIKE